MPRPGSASCNAAAMRIPAVAAIRACRKTLASRPSTMTVRRVEAVQKDRV